MHIIILLVGIIAVLIILMGVGYVIQKFMSFLVPVGQGGNGYTNSFVQGYNSAVNKGLSSWDESLVVIYMIVLIIACLWSYQKPNQNVAIVEVAAIFILGFLFLTVNPVIMGVENSLNSNSTLPYSTTAWNGGYIIYTTLAALVISAIFNFRSREGETPPPQDIMSIGGI